MNTGTEPTEEEIKIREAVNVLVSEYRFVPSAYQFHLKALDRAGLIDRLTAGQLVTIIQLMQQAYRNGEAHMQAEKIDPDAVWVNGVGMIEKKDEDNWLVTGRDESETISPLPAS